MSGIARRSNFKLMLLPLIRWADEAWPKLPLENPIEDGELEQRNNP
jgi:hypothetical protein